MEQDRGSSGNRRIATNDLSRGCNDRLGLDARKEFDLDLHALADFEVAVGSKQHAGDAQIHGAAVVPFAFIAAANPGGPTHVITLCTTGTSVLIHCSGEQQEPGQGESTGGVRQFRDFVDDSWFAGVYKMSTLCQIPGRPPGDKLRHMPNGPGAIV